MGSCFADNWTSGASTAAFFAEHGDDAAADVAQLQQQQQVSNMLPDTLNQCTWLQLLTVLRQQQRHQQHADMPGTHWEGQQDLQHPSGAHIFAACQPDMVEFCPAGEDLLTAGLPVTVEDGHSPGHVCLQLLQFLGCSLPLLQAADFQPEAAGATGIACSEPVPAADTSCF